MAENTKIQWTDHTFNPWRGCARVSPACDHCYADAQAKRNPKVLGRWGELDAGGTRVVASETQWEAVRHWNLTARTAGRSARVFCASMADVFEDWDGPVLNSQAASLDLLGYGRPLDRVRERLWHLILEQAAARFGLAGLGAGAVGTGKPAKSGALAETLRGLSYSQAWAVLIAVSFRRDNAELLREGCRWWELPVRWQLLTGGQAEE